MNWLKEHGFDDWRFWAILTFLVGVMVFSAVNKTGTHAKVMGDYPFINRNIA